MQCAKNVGSAAKLCAGVVDEDADSVGAAVLNTISAFLPEFKKLTRLGSMLVRLPIYDTPWELFKAFCRYASLSTYCALPLII